MPIHTSTNGALILEEPFIRTPYELLRRSHRSAQRQVEKDFTAVSAGLQNLLKSLSGSESSEEGRQALVKKLDQIGDRAKGLKRKLDDLQPSADQSTPLRARLNYLDALDDTQSAASGSKYTNGSRTKGAKADGLPKSALGGKTKLGVDQTVDRYIIDYLLRTGRMESAKALTEAQDLDNLVDVKLFAELVKIENALIEKHSCAEGLAWCGENRGTLKKTKNNLEFILRLQEFIELCRKRDVPSAIAYSRKNLAPWAVSHLPELQQAMTLLAFGERTGVGSYRTLYDPSRWELVRAHFRETFFTLYAQPSQPVLTLALSAGLSSLRLPSCVHHIRPTAANNGDTKPTSPTIPLLPAAPPLHNLESWLNTSPSHEEYEHLTAPVGGEHTSPAGDLHEHPEAAVGNVDCPTCGEHMKVLASEVPMSHHVNSTIVCRISGQVMDSQNEPLAFPNGYVYSSKALKQMAEANFNVVTCPRTRESCDFSRLRKVYIS